MEENDIIIDVTDQSTIVSSSEEEKKEDLIEMNSSSLNGEEPMLKVFSEEQLKIPSQEDTEDVLKKLVEEQTSSDTTIDGIQNTGFSFSLEDDNVTSDTTDEKLISQAVDQYTQDPKPAKEIKPRDDLDAYSRAVDYMCNLVMDGQAGSTNENAVCLFQLFEKIRKNAGRINFSVYNKLTPALKDEMKNAARANGIYRMQDIQMFTTATIMQMYQDLTIDSEWEKLQSDIKKANRMPEQMDIFGEVIYDKMVNNSLLKMVTLKTRNPGDNGWELFRNVAETYLNHYYFITMMSLVLENVQEFKKKDKNPKRLISDVDYIFKRVGIKTSIHTEAKTLYNKIVKKFGEKAATSLLIGIKIVLDEACVDPKGVRAQETSFLMSQFIGILAYINDDEEVRTEFGNQLVKNFNTYLKFTELMDSLYVTSEIINTSPDVVTNIFGEETEYKEFSPDKVPEEIIKSTVKFMHEQYNNAVESAIQKYENDIASKLDEEENHGVDFPADNNNISDSSVSNVDSLSSNDNNSVLAESENA